MGWIDDMDRRCLFCGGGLYVEPPGEDNPNVCVVNCPACGFHAMVSAPDGLRTEPFGPVFAVYRGGRAGRIMQ